jgi:hypothetical protein
LLGVPEALRQIVLTHFLGEIGEQHPILVVGQPGGQQRMQALTDGGARIGEHRARALAFDAGEVDGLLGMDDDGPG